MDIDINTKPEGQNPDERNEGEAIYNEPSKRIIQPLPGQAEDIAPSVNVSQTAPAIGSTAAAATVAPITPEQTVSPQPVVSAPVTAQPNTPTVVVGGDSGGMQQAPVVPNMAGPAPGTEPKKSRNKKKLALLIGAPLAVALLAAGGIFGLYLPNTPSGVWNTGISRTGTAVDKLVTTATTESRLEEMTSSEITGSLDVTFGENKISGDVTAAFDEKNLTSDLEVRMKEAGASEQTIKAALLLASNEGSQYPDVYVQLSGLAAAGLTESFPEFDQYDGKWLVADGEYIKSTLGMYTAGLTDVDTKDEVNAKDISEIARVATGVTRDYLFTTDESKAVLVRKSFVGKEQLEGQTMHHYKANINTANASAYCKELATSVSETAAFKRLTDRTDEQIKDDLKNIDDTCKIQEGPKKDIDVWIGGKHRLIHKMRIHSDSSDQYVDIGQNYDGGDTIELFTNIHEPNAKMTANVRLKLNTKDYSTAFDIDVKSEEYSIDFNLAAKPGNKKVDVTRPKDATPIKTIIEQLEAQNSTQQLQYQSELDAALRESGMENYDSSTTYMYN